MIRPGFCVVDEDYTVCVKRTMEVLTENYN